jgi:uncharacterized OB-fold protein
VSLQPLPEVTDDSAAFWSGGATGALNIHRCRQCRRWFHPPSPVCPHCLSLDVGPERASGRAVVQGFSVNFQPWAPDMLVPYVVAVVSIEEDDEVHLTTRLVDVVPEEVAVGTLVEVTFEQVSDDVHLPLFRPVVAEATA